MLAAAGQVLLHDGLPNCIEVFSLYFTVNTRRHHLKTIHCVFCWGVVPSDCEDHAKDTIALCRQNPVLGAYSFNSEKTAVSLFISVCPHVSSRLPMYRPSLKFDAGDFH